MPPLRAAQLAKVAGALGRAGDAGARGPGAARNGTLVIEEEESLSLRMGPPMVPPNWLFFFGEIFTPF